LKHYALIAVLSWGACACSCTGERGGGSEAQADAEVSGTVLDRTTGGPIADARVTFPDGREVRTNDAGRFSATGLPLGLSGELVARAGDGRVGQISLRPLSRRHLEVVVYVGL